ncbi:hypothetical protein KY345_02210 [Candidatus Woesearchaeota archaeon]|nr:hypothetical protein [Candidatus Woesearchaeota archaeon]
MSKDYKLPALLVRYKGVLDLEGLYRVIVQWLKARRYWFHETTYKHKVPSPFGAEEEIRFVGERKCTEYYKHQIMIYTHVWGQQEVEVIKEGKKQKLIKCKVEFRIQGTLITDYQGRFERNAFTRKLRDFMHKHLIKERLENIWGDELYYRTLKLQAVIKDYIDMYTKSHEYRGYLGDTG